MVRGVCTLVHVECIRVYMQSVYVECIRFADDLSESIEDMNKVGLELNMKC